MLESEGPSPSPVSVAGLECADDAPRLTHLDEAGRAHMVDVGDKDTTSRTAHASATVNMQPATLEALRAGTNKKGDVLATARIAGIQAAKRTPELIPLCHHVAISSVEVHFEAAADHVRIDARVRARDQTGVEMEALTAASVAALTLYDMLKAIDRGIVIGPVQLESKTGGARGDWNRS